MSQRIVCVDSVNLPAIATLNGRARVPVLLFTHDAPDAPLATDSLNPTSAKERARFSAAIGDTHPEFDIPGEVAPLLERLAAEAAAASVTETRDFILRHLARR